VNDFIRKIKATYPPYEKLEGDALNEAIFATKPGRGACGELVTFDVLGNVPNGNTHSICSSL